MEPIKIFVICPDPETLDKALEFLTQKEFDAQGVTDKESALEKFKEKIYDIVIIGGGIDNVTRDMFRKEFAKTNKEFEFVEHYGNPQNLLPELIESFEEF